MNLTLLSSVRFMGSAESEDEKITSHYKEKNKQTFPTLSFNQPITGKMPSGIHTTAGAFVLTEKNPEWFSLKQDILEETQNAILGAGGNMEYLPVNPKKMYKKQPKPHWCVEGPMHITLSFFKLRQPNYQNPMNKTEIEWVTSESKKIKPFYLMFDSLHLTKAGEIVATFIPDAKAENVRKIFRVNVYNGSDFQMPNIYHMTVARLNPGTTLDPQTDAQLVSQLQNLLSESTKRIQASHSVPKKIDRLTVVHNQISRGLYGQDKENPWGLPEHDLILNA